MSASGMYLLPLFLDDEARLGWELMKVGSNHQCQKPSWTALWGFLSEEDNGGEGPSAFPECAFLLAIFPNPTCVLSLLNLADLQVRTTRR